MTSEKPSGAKGAITDAGSDARASRGVKLDTNERQVLAQALERAASAHDTIERSLVDLGRWLFAHVFGEDSTAVIEHEADNAVWSALLSAADGAKLRLTVEALRSTLACAAYDKRLNSDAWRSLDLSRKSMLLRLGDDKLLRKAAQHVLAANLGVRDCEAYVRNVLAEQAGQAPAVRVNVTAFRGQLAKLTERVSARAFVRQLEKASKELDDEARSALVSELDAAQAALAELSERLRRD
jgi:hypothetical protein